MFEKTIPPTKETIRIKQLHDTLEQIQNLALGATQYPPKGYITQSHIGVAKDWDDALDILAYAAECGMTVDEMKLWRKAKRGEDLTVEAVEIADRIKGK